MSTNTKDQASRLLKTELDVYRTCRLDTMRSMFFALVGVLAGCSVIPQVPVHPTAGQSTGVLERDERECADAVKGRNSAIAYAGCMIARGYTAQVQVGPDPPVSARGWGVAGGRPALVASVTADRPVDSREAAADLTACRDEARATASRVVSGGRGGPLFTSFGADAMFHPFQRCMTPLGFSVREGGASPSSAPRP